MFQEMAIHARLQKDIALSPLITAKSFANRPSKTVSLLASQLESLKCKSDDIRTTPLINNYHFKRYMFTIIAESISYESEYFPTDS